jgi:hypothetical protein
VFSLSQTLFGHASQHLGQLIPNAVDLGVPMPNPYLMVLGPAGLCQDTSQFAGRLLVAPNPFGLYLVMPNFVDGLGVVTLGLEAPHHAEMGEVIPSLENLPGMLEIHEALCLVLSSLADPHRVVSNHAELFQVVLGHGDMRQVEPDQEE